MNMTLSELEDLLNRDNLLNQKAKKYEFSKFEKEKIGYSFDDGIGGRCTLAVISSTTSYPDEIIVKEVFNFVDIEYLLFVGYEGPISHKYVFRSDIYLIKWAKNRLDM